MLDRILAQTENVWHLTDAEGWQSVQARGLLSTSALLDLYGYEGERRDVLESRRRPRPVPLFDDELGPTLLSDNRPISDKVLRRDLDGITVEDWYRTLNSRVFFWADERRVDKHLDAPARRGRQQVVLTIDAAKLLERYGTVVELSAYNSGSTGRGTRVRRGPDFFARPDVYVWRRPNGRRRMIVEVTLPGEVTDVHDMVVDVAFR